jgi:hypothetical protein
MTASVYAPKPVTGGVIAVHGCGVQSQRVLDFHPRRCPPSTSRKDMTAEQNYTSLEDPHAFPPFNSCPHDVHCLIPKSWPDRHWCFLGEIEDISGIGRLCLDVRDREGTPARIYFYLDKIKPGVVCVVINPAKVTYPDHPNVPAPLVRKGNTIAVLYAEQHRWLAENSTGVRIEDGDTVKVCLTE